jgi:hypothetical protein
MLAGMPEYFGNLSLMRGDLAPQLLRQLNSEVGDIGLRIDRHDRSVAGESRKNL